MDTDQFRSFLAGVPEPDREAAAAAKQRWDSLMKPLGALGVLEDQIIRIASVLGSADFSLDRRLMYVICADNGVIAQGVSQSDESVTLAVAKALAEGNSTVNYMAGQVGCEVVPVDVGMKEDAGAEAVTLEKLMDRLHAPEREHTEPLRKGRARTGILDRNVRRGTADMSEGPAMTLQECRQAIETGIELAWEAKRENISLILLGEMGIGNTTTTSAICSVLLDVKPSVVTGRGAGLSDEGLERKIKAIEKAIHVNNLEKKSAEGGQDTDPDGTGDCGGLENSAEQTGAIEYVLNVLSRVGGLDIACLTGLILGGAMYRIPVLLDGVITLAAALCAVRMCPRAKGVLLASHVSAEAAAKLALEELGLQAPITANLHLGEGSGAAMALGLLDTALSVYFSGHTFDEVGVEAYQPL